MIVADTPEDIRFYAALQVKYALKIEVDTGMHHSRGSVLKVAKARYGVVSNTKKGAFAEMDAFIEGMHVGAAFARGGKFVVEPALPKQPNQYMRIRVRVAYERGIKYAAVLDHLEITPLSQGE